MSAFGLLRLFDSLKITKNVVNVSHNYIQARNTMILKRRHKIMLSKKNRPHKQLRTRHFYYDLVEDTCGRPQTKMNIILLKDVEDYGLRGDVLEIKSGIGYREFILPGLAVYNSPPNHLKYVIERQAEEKQMYSSRYVERTMGHLSELTLKINMSKTEPWILKPWHVRVSFRQQLIEVSESAIEMPSEEIRGPDLELENNEFFVNVTLNKMEKVKVKFVVKHHEKVDTIQLRPQLEFRSDEDTF